MAQLVKQGSVPFTTQHFSLPTAPFSPKTHFCLNSHPSTTHYHIYFIPAPPLPPPFLSFTTPPPQPPTHTRIFTCTWTVHMKGNIYSTIIHPYLRWASEWKGRRFFCQWKYSKQKTEWTAISVTNEPRSNWDQKPELPQPKQVLHFSSAC